uniref:Uncharacterized protein n=1 Tax=Peromyscus maniculatus bairdii TaxID=230844 RepID=A0A8C8UKA1_PERMB
LTKIKLYLKIWPWGLALLGSIWAALSMGALGLELILSCQELSDHHTISLPTPVSHYAPVTVICHVTTFHNYEDTALTLQNQIRRALRRTRMEHPRNGK